MIYEIDSIPLHGVCIHADTQSRVAMNEATIADYTEAIIGGADLPPVVTFFDGAVFWLADGFHRYFAHKAAGTLEIKSELHDGTLRDAVLYSVGANASHGLRRTNEDKRRAVMMLLNDAEWSAWSQEKIAKACSVSTGFVSKLANDASIHREEMKPAMRTVERNGKTYKQNTANIGKAKPFIDPVAQEATAEDAPAATAQQVPQSMATAGEVQALREQLAEIAENMKSTLADNEMMGRVFDADDRIRASMTEAIRQKAIADNAERTLAAKNGEFIERARAVTHWMNRAQKAEKALAKLGATQ